MRKLTVKSAVELSKEQKERLEAIKNSGDNLTYEKDDIVGGITVFDGQKVLDASIANKLQKVKKASLDISLKEGVNVLDIPKLIKEKLDDILKSAPQPGACGKVVTAADGIVKIEGLPDCKSGELLLIGKSSYALSMNLETGGIGAILLGGIEAVEYGDLVFSTGKIIEVPVGKTLLGRVISPLGEALDDRGEIKTDKSRRIECDAPRIVDREKVNEPLSTGILAIDSMIPIGKGQRELIIGDRQTGKTSIAVDTIINQKDKNVYCIYVAIGQRAASISKLVKTLEEHGAMAYTTVVLSTASDAAPLQYIAPYTGAAIAEHFMYEGKDVLIVYDDLSKHAVAYRTISLLLKRPAGREAYPGDIFYIHSKLLERSAKLNKKLGGGSITALPIIETQAGDISAYIPTNVISITDGQIYLEGELFKAGQRPAINVGLSVSRVGGSAQTKLMKKLSAQLRLDIAHYRELAIFSQFGSSLDQETRNILINGAKTVEALKQPEFKPLDTLREQIYLFAIVNGYLKKVPVTAIREFLDGLYNYVKGVLPGVCKSIVRDGDLNEYGVSALKDAVTAYLDNYGGEDYEKHS